MPILMINDNKYSPKLILFDVDGTLVDDKHRYSSLGKARYNAFKKLASENAAKEWTRLAGVNPSDWSIDPMGPISKAPRRDDLAIAAGALYLDGLNWYEARKLADTIYAKADEEQRLVFKPRLLDGVLETLKTLKDAGYMLGIATNGVTGITEEILTGLGIKDHFEVVVGADLVEHSKPAPDMILYACEKLGIEPSDCLYVGDQPTDMEAAGEAGVIGVGVNNRELAEISGSLFVDSIKMIQVIGES